MWSDLCICCSTNTKWSPENQTSAQIRLWLTAFWTGFYENMIQIYSDIKTVVRFLSQICLKSEQYFCDMLIKHDCEMIEWCYVTESVESFQDARRWIFSVLGTLLQRQQLHSPSWDCVGFSRGSSSHIPLFERFFFTSFMSSVIFAVWLLEVLLLNFCSEVWTCSWISLLFSL